MKSWLLAFALIPILGWILVRPIRNTVLPQLVREGTDQILAQWRDALLAYKADEGQFPPLENQLAEDGRIMGEDEARMAALLYRNKAEKAYLDKTSVRLEFAVQGIDPWQTPLAFDPLKNGDQSHIVSAGPDLQFGTADDIDSRNAIQRNLEVPLEMLNERDRRRVEATKAEKDKAKSPQAANKADKESPPDAP